VAFNSSGAIEIVSGNESGDAAVTFVVCQLDGRVLGPCTGFGRRCG
jgi:hypothetical protein